MSVQIREKQKANGDIALYLDIYHRGKRHCEYLDLFLNKDRQKNKEVRRLAEDIRSKRQLELSANNYQITPHFKSKTNFIEYFTDLSETKHRSWKTTLIHLKGFAGATLPFSLVDERWLVSFQKYLLNLVSKNTAQTYFNKIKAALNYARREKLIQVNPADNIENIKGEEVERIYLTFEEIQKLNETPLNREVIKRAFLFACFTGLRLSDVRRLQWKNIQGEQLSIRVKKTGQPEYMPLSKSAMKFLGERGNSDEFVFKIMKGEDNIWNVLQRWGKAAEIEKHISFHVSRHTFATLALTSGVDLYAVGKLLGHTNIKNTQIYAQIVDQKKKDAVNLMPEI
jgi:integrase